MHNNLSISNFKLYIKRFIAVVLTLAVILGCVSYYNRLTDFNYGEETYTFYNFMDKNTCDVVFVGSSHVFNGVNTVTLWDEYDIAAYDFAVPGMPMWVSWLLVKEFLKRQDPELVILDIYMISRFQKDVFANNLRRDITALRPSVDKYRILKEQNAENALDILWGFPINHTRYKEIEKNNFDFDMQTSASTLGFLSTIKIHEFENPDELYKPTGEEGLKPCLEEQEKYLRECIEYCQSKNQKVMLLCVPYPTITAEDKAIFNYVENIADEYGIDFLDGNEHVEDIGLDYRCDALDVVGHLNDKGATKFAHWFGENYLVPNGITQHREDKNNKKYRLWNTASGTYRIGYEWMELEKIEDKESFLNRVNEMGDWTYMETDEGDSKTGIIITNKDFNKKQMKAVFDSSGKRL